MTSSILLAKSVTLNGLAYCQFDNRKTGKLYWHCKENKEKVTHSNFKHRIDSTIDSNDSSVVAIESDADPVAPVA